MTATVQARLNPYVGPRAFQPGETLYGRDSEVLELLDLVLAERIVLLHSPSGAGKTSLIQAALIPRLEQEGFEVLPVIRVSLEQPVGTDTGEGLNHYVLSTHLSLEEDRPTDKQFAVADLARMSLDDYLSRRPAESDNRVLIFDQFEEVLLNPADQADKRAFFQQLGAALRPRDRWVLFAMRDDYVATLDPYLGALPTRARTKFRLDFLTQQAASQAVQRPAEQAGITFSEGTVTKLVEDLSQVWVQQPDGSSQPRPGPYVEPVQLQVVCLRLWDRLGPEQKEIGESDIESAWDVDKALSMYYAQQVADVARRTGVSERSIREWFDSQLILEQRFRGQAREGPQDSIGDARPALLLLEDAHLIRAEQRRGTTWYELAHDRLVAPVLADNKQWRQEHLHALQRQARIWDDEDRPEGLLFRGRELAEAETWAAEHADELTKLDREFLDACHGHARAGRRRLYARILVGLAAAAVILAGAAVWVQADRQAFLEQRVLLAQYEATLDSDPAASLRDALQAWRKLATADAERAVRTAVESDNLRRVFRADRGYFTSSEFSPDSQALLTAGSDGTATLFNATNGQLIRTFQPRGTEPPPAMLQAAASADGTMVLTTASNRTVGLYDLNTGDSLGTLEGVSGATWGTVNGQPVILTYGGSAASLWDPQGLRKIGDYGDRTVDAALSPDGRHVLTVDYATSKVALSVWDAASGRRLQTSAPVGFSASEAQFVAAGWDKVVFRASDRSNISRVMLWDWQQGANVSQPTDANSRLAGPIVVSKDGHSFAAAVDKHVTVFDAEKGQPIGEIPDQPDGITTIDLSADGSSLVTGGSDGRAMVWNAHRFNSRPIAELLGHAWGISDVQFAPNSRWRLTTASRDGTARTWQLAPYAVLTPGSQRMLDTDIATSDTDITGQLMLVTAGDTGDLQIYERSAEGRIDQWRQLARTSMPSGLGSAKLTPGGRMAVSARLRDFAPSVWVWDSGKPPYRLSASDRFLTALAISGDGRSVAAGDASNRVIVWDLGSDRITARLGVKSAVDQATRVTYVPHSTLVAVGSTDGTVRLFDTANPAQPLRILGRVGDPAVKALDVSADGTHLAIASEDRNVRVWRVSDGTLEKTIGGPPSASTDVAFSPDGKLVALAAADGAVHIWEWQTDDKLAVLRRHVDAINSVQFSPDGNNIITASDDATVAIFPCTTCQLFEELLPIAEEQDRNHR